EGSIFAFEFVLADGRKVLAGEGKVTAVSSDPHRPGMTLALRALDAESQALITRFSNAGAGATSKPSVDPAAEERRRRRQAILEGPAPAPPPSGQEPVIGIDLGTTICRAAVWLKGEVKLLPLDGRSTSLPSFVALDERGRLLVGARAKAHLMVDPKSTVFGAKRLIGRRTRSPKVREIAVRFPSEVCPDDYGDTAVRLQGRVYPIPQIASFLLAEIRNRASEALGCKVSRAVIGVPAYFNDRQRQAVHYAGKLAGLDVWRVISEPTAVAIAFGFGKGLTRKRLLVYDLGGGTFDASLLEATGNDFEVIGAGGENFLGGLDFDARLAGWLDERFQQIQQFALPGDPLTRQRVRDAAETAKIALSERADTRVHLAFVAKREEVPVDLDVSVDRGRFESLTRDLVERSLMATRAVFEAAQVDPTAVDEVLLVGGQSQSQGIREAVEAVVGRSARRDVDPHASVAIGAALVGQALQSERAGSTGGFTLSYDEMLSLAIGYASPGGSFERVLERGTRLPCEKVASVNADREGHLRLSLFQGEAKDTVGNEFLGKLVINGRPTERFDVTFAVSQGGVLTVLARGVDGEQREMTLATADTSEEARAALVAPPGAPVPFSPTGFSAPAAPGQLEDKKGLLSKLFGKK
ncbi:MAG: Hsp70 family protein, partial [Deltaproteobacteria bacterium]|nr:Hsp70 family protein [Deltaproteobacteria bacterium]